MSISLDTVSRLYYLQPMATTQPNALDQELIDIAAEFGLVFTSVRAGVFRCADFWIIVQGDSARVSGPRGVIFRGATIDTLRAVSDAL